MMIDISKKKITKRKAVASGNIVVKAVNEKLIPKGDVLSFAESSALLAIKHLPYVIPHCNPVKITKALIKFKIGKEGIVLKLWVKLKDLIEQDLRWKLFMVLLWHYLQYMICVKYIKKR